MIQLMFDASSASDALNKAPTEIGYSQHDGAERAAWNAKKLQKRGTHPVVYPARGSHANFFTSSLWLGHSAQEGFGCDDTRGPSRMEQTHAVLLPDRPASKDSPFAWLAFYGLWGQKEHGPNSGPTGPNTKVQWTEPVSWAEDTWRSGSTTVPLTATVGPSATEFFCDAVAAGSAVYLRFLRTPWFVVGFVGLLVLLALWLGRRTRWSPVHTVPIDQARTGGQIYRTARVVYRLDPGLFIGIGLMFVPLGVLAALLQDLLQLFTGFGNFISEASTDPVITGVIALLFGELSTIVASVLVTAAVVVALETMDRGARPTVRAAYRGVLPHGWSLGWAWLRVILVCVLLSLTVVGLPIAIFYLVRKTVLTQACVSEHLPATVALRRSSNLVGRRVLRVFAIAALVNVTAFLLGPIVGIAMLFLTSGSLVVINLVSSLVYVVVIPYAGIAIALLYYDLRRREQGEEPVVSPRARAAPITSH
jgi:hypothetical protein